MPVEPADRFTIRGYRPGDEVAILDLFARSFHQPMSAARWRWKYEDDPFGREHISVATDGEKLVAQYAAYAAPFRLEADDLLANQVGDTMTDIAIRHVGRGPSSVLGRTAMHFYKNFCEGKVAFNYGFNVANIQKFSMRFLRSDRVEPVPYRIRDLRSDPLPALSRLERYARGLQFELALTTAGEWDALFDDVARHYGFLARRDANYVRWRYLDCPDAHYAVVAMRKWRMLVGWLVFRIREGRLTVGDLLLHPDHPDALELALRHLAHVYQVEAIEGWFPGRPRWLDEIFHSMRFESRPEPQNLSLMCVPFDLPDATARMREALYYTMGDGDLF